MFYLGYSQTDGISIFYSSDVFIGYFIGKKVTNRQTDIQTNSNFYIYSRYGGEIHPLMPKY